LTRHASRHAVLSETPAYDDKGRLRVVIETPKGSQVKYAYNPVCDCFELKTVMPEGMTFPYDFGFVPSTLGEDGDPLDVLVLMDFPVVPGCILTVRPIGVIKAEQKDKGKKWARNDRLISVATHARIHDEAHSLKGLGPHLLKEISAFFVNYNHLHDKKFKLLGESGAQTASELVKVGQKRFEKRHSKN